MPIPAKITIDGKEIEVSSSAELQTLINEARKEEKEKLYSDIRDKEAKIKVLEDEQRKNGDLTSAKEKELKKLQDELAVAKSEKEKLEKEKKSKAKRKADEDDDEDEDDEDEPETKGKKKSAGLSLKDFEALMEKREKAFEAKLAELAGQQKHQTVREYRKEQLEKNKGLIEEDLIDDLVPDSLDSQDAVNKAIEKALAKSKKYITKEYTIDGKAKKMTIAEYEQYRKDNPEDTNAGGEDEGAEGADAEGKDKTPTFKPRQTAAKPGGGNGDLSGKTLLERAETMSQEEYEKNRPAIMAEAERLMQTGG